MRTAIVRFVRLNSDDEDCATSNFPKLIDANREAALIDQFNIELKEVKEFDGKWKIVCTHYTEEKLWLWLTFLMPYQQTVEELADKIQAKCFDKCGMTGVFEVIDLQPRSGHRLE
jgi:hypothetical protein